MLTATREECLDVDLGRRSRDGSTIAFLGWTSCHIGRDPAHAVIVEPLRSGPGGARATAADPPPRSPNSAAASASSDAWWIEYVQTAVTDAG